LILDIFRHIRTSHKKKMTFNMPVFSSICIYQLSSHYADFCQIWSCRFLLKSSQDNTDSVKIGQKYQALYMKT